MFSFLRRSTTPLLAIDVSSESLQLLEVITVKNHFHLHRYHHTSLPMGTVSAQRIMDITAFGQAFAKAVKQFKPLSKKVALALPVNQVISKTIPILSHLTPTEVTKHLQQEITLQTPAPLSEIYWDYVFLPTRGETKEIATREVLVNIVQRSSIAPYLQAIHACGLSLHTVDVESYALARAWQFCYSALVSPQEAHALLFLRAQLVTLVLITESRVMYARAWPVENTTHYETAFLSSAQQLWQALPIVQEPGITQIWLTGEYALPAYTDLVHTAFNLPATLIEFPSTIFFPQNKEEQFFPPPNAIFLSLGLALWGEIR